MSIRSKHYQPFIWWKILACILLLYAFIFGFIGNVPRLAILNETIRNLYFHVPMWFAMTLFLLVSAIQSILFLNSSNLKYDRLSAEFNRTGMLFGMLGILTGMVWAKFTWGTFWTKDPKLNAAQIGLLLYAAYLILREAIQEEDKKARISAVFNLFIFPAFVSLIYILPRLTDSLHPGNGGNPGFNTYDRDHEMNIIFYSAVIGFILLGAWITQLRYRLKKWADAKEGLNY